MVSNMAISKIVDNRSYSNKPDDSASCMKGSSDCQYLTESGGCSAEWCIFEELPKMINSSRELTCSICGKNKKSFSSYSGVRSYICDECNKKIKKITVRREEFEKTTGKKIKRFVESNKDQ